MKQAYRFRLMTIIEIDPPAYGPLRLGMTGLEVRKSLGSLGHISEAGGLTFSEEPGSGLFVITRADERGRLSWVASGPDGARFMFRGTDLAQSAAVVLRSLLALGLRIISDRDQTHYLAEDVGLLLAVSEPDDFVDFEAERFETLAIGTPAQLQKATSAVHHRIPVEAM